jgi:peroxiredoxin
MTLTPSTVLKLGIEAAPFKLPDTNGRIISLNDLADKPALLVMFICNHCPFVRHVAPELARLYRDYSPRGLGMVGINSNDIKNYPEDSPAKMKEMAQKNGWEFPYLFDEKQSVARAYSAACTPDFFLFDQDRHLYYHGQLDDSRPGKNVPLTGQDMRDALESLLAGRPAPSLQKPSIGCNVKWKPTFAKTILHSFASFKLQFFTFFS